MTAVTGRRRDPQLQRRSAETDHGGSGRLRADVVDVLAHMLLAVMHEVALAFARARNPRPHAERGEGYRRPARPAGREERRRRLRLRAACHMRLRAPVLPAKQLALKKIENGNVQGAPRRLRGVARGHPRLLVHHSTDSTNHGTIVEAASS